MPTALRRVLVPLGIAVAVWVALAGGRAGAGPPPPTVTPAPALPPVVPLQPPAEPAEPPAEPPVQPPGDETATPRRDPTPLPAVPATTVPPRTPTAGIPIEQADGPAPEGLTGPGASAAAAMAEAEAAATRALRVAAALDERGKVGDTYALEAALTEARAEPVRRYDEALDQVGGELTDASLAVAGAAQWRADATRRLDAVNPLDPRDSRAERARLQAEIEQANRRLDVASMDYRIAQEQAAAVAAGRRAALLADHSSYQPAPTQAERERTLDDMQAAGGRAQEAAAAALRGRIEREKLMRTEVAAQAPGPGQERRAELAERAVYERRVWLADARLENARAELRKVQFSKGAAEYARLAANVAVAEAARRSSGVSGPYQIEAFPQHPGSWAIPHDLVEVGITHPFGASIHRIQALPVGQRITLRAPPARLDHQGLCEVFDAWMAHRRTETKRLSSSPELEWRVPRDEPARSGEDPLTLITADYRRPAPGESCPLFP